MIVKRNTNIFGLMRQNEVNITLNYEEYVHTKAALEDNRNTLQEMLLDNTITDAQRAAAQGLVKIFEQLCKDMKLDFET